MFVRALICVGVWGWLRPSVPGKSICRSKTQFSLLCVLALFLLLLTLNPVKLFDCSFSVRTMMLARDPKGLERLGYAIFWYFSPACSSFSFLLMRNGTRAKLGKYRILFFLFGSATFICGLWLMPFCCENSELSLWQKPPHKRATTLSLIFISLALCAFLQSSLFLLLPPTPPFLSPSLSLSPSVGGVKALARQQKIEASGGCCCSHWCSPD